MVDALVTSATRAPVSQQPSRSGISSAVCAAASAAVPCAATSWNTVLNGCTCRPVRAYSSAAGIVAKTVSGTPSVRASR